MTEEKAGDNKTDAQSKGGKESENAAFQPIGDRSDKAKADQIEHEATAQQQQATKFEKVWKWLTKKEKEANLADYLIVLLTAVIAFWAGMTWWEMHGAGAQTDKIIAADERMATAMETTVNNAIETSRNDQRAWLGISSIPNVCAEIKRADRDSNPIYQYWQKLGAGCKNSFFRSSKRCTI